VYLDPNVVDIACAGLNGLKMGDRTLTVRRAAEVRHIYGACGVNVQGLLGALAATLLPAHAALNQRKTAGASPAVRAVVDKA
jgi:hypothetical protein